MGMGMAAGVGGTVGASVGGMVQNALTPHRAEPVPAPAQNDFEARLKKLEMLKGKIPDEQYDAKMQEILSDI